MRVPTVAIVGFGMEGRAAFEYFAKRGADITICDQNATPANLPVGAKMRVGPNYLEGLDDFDIIMRTPALKPEKLLESNPGVADKISSNTNEFLRAQPTRNIIGVTGTKGKGTTATLIANMLKASGKTVFLGGNIGIPALSFIDQVRQDDWVVLELSSFQLADLKHSPRFAVCVLVVPEHLDWHDGYPKYLAAKANLFRHQTPDAITTYYAHSDASCTIASAGNAQLIPYYNQPGAHVDNGAIMIDDQLICATDELRLLGQHNWQNVCAAVTTVWQITQDVAAIRSVLTTFDGLPHRIEFIREKDGIRYYNDSYATGLHATEAAIKAVPDPVVAIIGGYDRMLPLEGFVNFAKNAPFVRQFLVIGACQERVLAAFEAAGITNATPSAATNIEAIVADAQALAKTGDSILLSPGFPSFDMFKNFEIRGNAYRTYVNKL